MPFVGVFGQWKGTASPLSNGGGHD